MKAENESVPKECFGGKGMPCGDMARFDNGNGANNASPKGKSKKPFK